MLYEKSKTWYDYIGPTVCYLSYTAGFVSNFNIIVTARSMGARNLLIDWVRFNMVKKWVKYYHARSFAGSFLCILGHID